MLKKVWQNSTSRCKSVLKFFSHQVATSGMPSRSSKNRRLASWSFTTKALWCKRDGSCDSKPLVRDPDATSIVSISTLPGLPVTGRDDSTTKRRWHARCDGSMVGSGGKDAACWRQRHPDTGEFRENKHNDPVRRRCRAARPAAEPYRRLCSPHRSRRVSRDLG